MVMPATSPSFFTCRAGNWSRGGYVFFVPASRSKPKLVIARAPTRVDFGGGWTDVPPYCDREGGFVCNAAIARHAEARLSSVASGRAGGVEPDEPLLRAASRHARLRDVDVKVTTDFPVGAGLGGSSAASAAVLAAGITWNGGAIDLKEIAETGRRIEVEELGIAGGRQDHYAATHGGALALTFTTTVSARRIALDAALRREIADRSVLVYTGESRISGDTITAVLGAYEAGEKRVVQALARMRELAKLMASALDNGSVDDLGRLVGEHWEHQRSLHATIPTPRIDAIVATSRKAGAIGAKAMGASGGGCVLAIARGGGGERLREALRSLGEILRFEIDTEGLTVRSEAA